MSAHIIPLEMPALFIPLKSEFFEAFADGSKTTEFRQYGPRWNERSCPIGRRVTLSKGYGIRHRMTGLIVGFEVSAEPTKSEAWRKCYGENPGALAACIRIRIDGRTAA